MLFNISSGFLNTANPSSLKMASKLTNIPKMVILGNIDVNERESWGTYVGVR